MSHIEETLGMNYVQCGNDHEHRNAYKVSVIDMGDGWQPSMVMPALKVGGLSVADWDWATAKFGLTANHTGLLTCSDCMLDRPSRLALIAENLARLEAKTKIATPAHEELGDDLVHCPECDTDFNADEMVVVRYCSFCEITFNGTDNGRNCEDCNRPFTRKCSDNGCPECLSEDSECEAVS